MADVDFAVDSITVVDAGGSVVDVQEAEPLDYLRASCGSPEFGPALAEHLTESDQDYVARLESLDLSVLPTQYELNSLFDLDRSIISYMLDAPLTGVVTQSDLLAHGLMGRAVLLALGTDPAPIMADLKELRRGLFHYYNCSRGHPARLEDFVALYGDYYTWQTMMIEDSDPKIYPRRLWNNDALGIYVAETIRSGMVHETEILMSGYRNDNALEFLAYTPNGDLTNRGEFKAGANFVAGAAPYVCMSCHVDNTNNEYTIIFPDLGHSH